jgi:hypothetical protein
MGTSTGPTVPMVFSNESTTKAEVWVSAPTVKRRRLGSVLAGETATLRVPREFYTEGTINFSATLRDRPVVPVLDNLRVQPDEELRLRLPIDTKRIVAIR